MAGVLAVGALASCATTQSAAFEASTAMPLAGALAWDSNREVMVVFEYGTGRVWDWDGSEFDLRLGASHAAEIPCTFDPVHGVIHASNSGNWTGGMWNGVDWTFSNTPVSGVEQMCYDVGRQRLVATGGTGVGTSVIEFDGTQWTTVTPPASPGTGGSLAWDPSRGAIVMAVGTPITLWTWDGAQWHLLDNSMPPSPAFAAYELRYEPAGDRLVVHGFGGSPSTPFTIAFDGSGWTTIPTPPTFSSGATLSWDGSGLLRLGWRTYRPEGVWRLEGNVWRKLPIEHPRYRHDTALAATPAMPGVLLFGGRAGSGPAGELLGDTWVYDKAWVRQQPANAPSPRRVTGLAWSPADQAFLLFGGLGDQNLVLTDTWTWDGVDWLQRSAPNGPSEVLRLVTDPGGRVLALPEGSLSMTTTQWRWTGADWRQSPGPIAEYPNSFLAPGYDPIRNVVTAAVGTEVHEWDGQSWTNLGALPWPYNPAVRASFRPDTQRMLFFGGGVLAEWDGTNWHGANVTGTQVSTNGATDFARGRFVSFQHNFTSSPTQGWNGVSATLTSTPASAERFGYGCAIGASPGLLTNGRPTRGESTFGITAVTFAPNALAALSLGLDTQPQHIGAGCVSWIAPAGATIPVITDPAGSALVNVPIPPGNALLGVSFVAQAVVVDPPRSPLLGLTFSSGLRITIGD